MATRQALFDLIASMNKTEKRYFKLQASLHARAASHVYVHLFDAVDAMACYDDSAFDNALRATGSSVETQKYLYEALLRSLHLYHRDQSVETAVRTLLHQADILFTRKLYSQAKPLVWKAKQLARKHQRFVDLLDVLKFEYRLVLVGQHEPNTLQQHVDGLFAEMKYCLAAEESSVVYGELNAKMFYYNHTAAGHPRTLEHIEVYDEIMDTPAMRDYSHAVSTQAKILYWNNLALYHELRRDYRSKLTCHLALLDLLASEEVPDDMKRRFYRLTLHNICSAACSIHQYDTFFEYHEKLLSLLETSPQGVESPQYIQALALLPRVYIVQGEFGRATEEVQKIEAVLQDSGTIRPGVCMYISHLGFYAQFGIGNYTRALHYIGELLCDRTGELVRPDLYYAARLLEILVHYELGNMKLVASLVRAAAKFLRSRNHLHKAEAAVLRFFRSASRSGADTASALDRLHRDLLPLLDDRFEIVLLAVFNFLEWAESKRTGRSFAEVARSSGI